MQHFVEGGTRAGSGGERQAVEVLPQNFARQEDRADANASLLNFGRNEVLSAVVLLREPLNYSLSFKRECLARSDSDQCLDFHWLLEPSGYLVPVVGRR